METEQERRSVLVDVEAPPRSCLLTLACSLVFGQGDDIYQDNADRAFIDCGEGSDNNFCDASSSNSEISTNFPVSVCAGASTSC